MRAVTVVVVGVVVVVTLVVGSMIDDWRTGGLWG